MKNFLEGEITGKDTVRLVNGKTMIHIDHGFESGTQVRMTYLQGHFIGMAKEPINV